MNKINPLGTGVYGDRLAILTTEAPAVTAFSQDPNIIVSSFEFGVAKSRCEKGLDVTTRSCVSCGR
jgi:hypothetical protein